MSTVGFWRELRQDNRDINISSNHLGKISRPWFLFPQGNGPRGSFATFANLKPNLRSRDVIILGGVLREQAVAPDDVYDVSIIGAANQPRQATSGGVPTGGGACWLAPTTPVASTPLLEVRSQGWSFENIEFTPANASAAVRLTRSATVDTIDAGHASFQNCYFAGNGGTTQIGIEDNGGCRSVVVQGCRFEGLGGTALLSLNTAAAIPLAWLIEMCQFQQNTNDIRMSLSYASILKNRFMTAGAGGHVVINDTFIAVQGGNNQILLNQFSNTEAEIAPATGFTGAASDTWMNYVNNQAALAFGQPA
jgi:hypothetical protein